MSTEKKTIISKEKVPEEIQEQILSRVPARKVAQYRVACKRWWTLTSSSHFISIHTKNWYNQFMAEILIDEEDPQPQNPHNHISTLHPAPPSLRLRSSGILGPFGHKMVAFSSFGFIVLRDQGLKSTSCELYNPATKENVKLMVLDEDVGLGGCVYAIFLHPKFQELCVLWGQRERLSPNTTEFKLLNLKSAIKTGSCWRNIVPRLHKYSPRKHSNRVVPPVNLKNVLYWMIDPTDIHGVQSCEDAILAFDIEREEFTRLPHPGPYCSGNGSSRHENMHLLQTRGTNQHENLYLCEVHESGYFISVWERKSGNWITRHKINCHELIRSSWPKRSTLYPFKILGMLDEESLLVAEQRTVKLYAANLKHGSMEEMELGEDGSCMYRFSFVWAHTPSFATLTDSSRRGDVLVRVPTKVRAICRIKGVTY